MRKFESIFERTAIVAATLLMPMMAVAATIDTGLEKLKTILNAIIGILFLVVTLYFIWGVIQYISAGGKEEDMKKGKDHMIWGIIGLAVVLGAWGIARVVLDTFFEGGNRGIPTLPGQ